MEEGERETHALIHVLAVEEAAGEAVEFGGGAFFFGEGVAGGHGCGGGLRVCW